MFSAPFSARARTLKRASERRSLDYDWRRVEICLTRDFVVSPLLQLFLILLLSELTSLVTTKAALWFSLTIYLRSPTRLLLLPLSRRPLRMRAQVPEEDPVSPDLRAALENIIHRKNATQCDVLLPCFPNARRDAVLVSRDPPTAARRGILDGGILPSLHT